MCPVRARRNRKVSAYFRLETRFEVFEKIGAIWQPGACNDTNIATSLAFYRSQKGLSLKNSEKSLKRGSRGLSAPGSKKPEKESKMTIFSSFFRVFGPFSTFFRLFLSFFDPGAERPRNPFSDFFRSFLGRGLFDSCRRPTMSQY